MKFKMLACLLAVPLALAALLSVPQTTLAACACVPGGVTLTYTGTGTTCANATNDLDNQAHPEAVAGCATLDGLCNETLIISTACYLDGGVWKVQGRIRYRCYAC